MKSDFKNTPKIFSECSRKFSLILLFMHNPDYYASFIATNFAFHDEECHNNFINL